MLPLLQTSPFFLLHYCFVFCLFFKETIFSYLNLLYSYNLSLLDGKIKQVLGFYWYASLLWSKEAKICVFLYLIMCDVSKDYSIFSVIFSFFSLFPSAIYFMLMLLMLLFCANSSQYDVSAPTPHWSPAGPGLPEVGRELPVGGAAGRGNPLPFEA